ncbi:MAG: DNA modification methylase [bacterium (Candidatus Stahlbacteria) CG08_land_8_20_14_0_20_40_26]|nr:MAG: DNA modification methylase [bacterium (Candidatus Stahlbacteria) CG23_combo_of_CG06-09_8_20_14_all_40_9]PIS25852.1 MAG: DNA modification methylase [bacterium (Candidatus Stahlbacteria) CG08_land_8_20_14_0_20_40_26]
MTFEDLKRLYLKKRKQLGSEVYKHISELLEEAKEIHRNDWLKNPTPNKDHEQSWRAFKGKNLEKLVQYIITDEVEELGLKVINGNKLERTTNLSKELSQVKRNLAIDYGEFGLHLPDVDIIIYDPRNYKVLAAISSKVTLRERIAQTGYWKLKLLHDEATKHIKVYFITPDEDGTLTHKKPTKKGRAIVEVDLDGSYVLTEEEIEESDKVKLFEHFVEDLKKLLNERQ